MGFIRKAFNYEYENLQGIVLVPVISKTHQADQDLYQKVFLVL